ncbi:MAG: VWA domain-containing protein [Acidobacteriota bacterium]
MPAPQRLLPPVETRHFLLALALLSAAVAALCAPRTAVAQETGEGAEAGEDVGGFMESVDTEIVNIDVWVTDRDGGPVEGLSRDDFLVFRDGEGVPISNFYAVAGGVPVGEAPPQPLPDAPGRSAVELERLGVGSDIAPQHRLWLIVFIDNYNIDPIERNRVLPGVRRFLGQTLRPGDRAMLVTYDRGLKVRQPFTDRRDEIFAQLDEITEESGLATIRRRDRLEALERIDKSRRPTEALLAARNYAEEQMNSVEYTIDALERLVNSLGGLPGRKALVHVSSGIPRLAGEELFQAAAVKWDYAEAYAEIPRHDTTRSFERAMRYANTHRVVFYTLDAGGLRGLEFGAAEYGTFVSPKLRTTLDSVVPENLQSSLRLMADETGGRAIVNRNEVLPALEEAAQDFASFYSLGIVSDGVSSGRYHDIEVELKAERRGVQIRHRAGYRSKSQQTKMRESLRSALLYAHQTNPLGLDVRWGTPEPHDDDSWLVPIQLRLPLRDLVLLPLGGKRELKLELYVGAAGDQGEISEIDLVPLGLRIAEENVEAALDESFVYVHKLVTSPGRKKIGLAILDVFGRQSSIRTGFLDVGPGG